MQDYEALRPYIDDQRRTGAPALTAEATLFYARTSGTTGKPKHIPITPSVLAMQRAEQALFSYLQYRACPRAFTGKAFGIMGAAVEGHLDSGHAVWESNVKKQHCKFMLLDERQGSVSCFSFKTLAFKW